jgi:hypothetical protein
MAIVKIGNMLLIFVIRQHHNHIKIIVSKIQSLNKIKPV